MLLAQMYNRWDPRSGWKILTSEVGQVFIDTMRDWVEARGLFPPPTDPHNPQEVVYEFRHRESNQRATLSIEDRAGVDSETLPDDALDRLNRANGLILLIDPERATTRIGWEIIRTLERLHLQSSTDDIDSRPLAICLSKADKVIRTVEDLRRAVAEPDTFVRDWIGGSLSTATLDKINTYSSNHRFFPISSVGVLKRYGVVEQVVFHDEYLTERIRRGGQPLNLEAPFVWIFEQLGAK
jgi:hypothetical protein